MKEEIYISERQKNFKIHKSLSDEPINFETSKVRGSIFYLPLGGELSGDTFIIRADDYLTVSIVEDIAGHGAKGRERLLPFIDNLERISYTASVRRFKIKDFVYEISKLDGKLDFDHLLALSFVRIMPDNIIYYLNEGENQLVICKKGRIYNPSSEISHGKIGILHEIMSEGEIMQKVVPSKEKLSSGDKILISTDGIFDYMEDANFIPKRKEEVERIFSLPLTLTEIITKINESAENELKNKGKELPPDDYTIIGLELK